MVGSSLLFMHYETRAGIEIFPAESTIRQAGVKPIISTELNNGWTPTSHIDFDLKSMSSSVSNMRVSHQLLLQFQNATFPSPDWIIVFLSDLYVPFKI